MDTNLSLPHDRRRVLSYVLHKKISHTYHIETFLNLYYDNLHNYMQDQTFLKHQCFIPLIKFNSFVNLLYLLLPLPASSISINFSGSDNRVCHSSRISFMSRFSKVISLSFSFSIFSIVSFRVSWYMVRNGIHLTRYTSRRSFSVWVQ